MPSRGCNVQKLKDSRWWAGPAWLKLSPDEWPESSYQCKEEEVNMEKRKTAIVMLTTDVDNDWYYRKFSKYDTVVKVQAWVIRFTYNCRSKRRDPLNFRSGELSVEELDNAENQIFKYILKEHNFYQDKKFHPLRIIHDPDGICRVKTKIIYRDDTNNFRLPIVLPPQHRVVKMLIMKTHISNGHCGSQILLNKLRERFWIIRGRKLVRSMLKSCVICRRQETKALEAEASPLPFDRVRNALVFEICGVDFAGPLYLKDGSKAWVCLFTCAIYRAVHLELTSSLSTEAFTLVLRRFIARRGRPRSIFSDNSTSFHGTYNLLKNVNWEKIKDNARIYHIEWRFNPPSAAWWGGWWERLIRLLKDLLKRILQRASLYFEEMTTILCDCEAVMNSRPLTYMSDSEFEIAPLTPAMFIQEVDEIGVPDLDASDARSLNKRLRYRQKLRRNLRERFRIEYLGQLAQRTSKTNKPREIKIGEIVLMGSDHTKRIDWPLARIMEVIPGRDGISRVVRLRTEKGEFIRPIQRIYPLEIESSNDRKILVENLEPTKGNEDMSEPK